MARPRLPLDEDQVYKLARIGCTYEEIGEILGCSKQTIAGRFSDVCARARSEMKMSIRRAQYYRAVKERSDTMLLHMGKVYCGQDSRTTQAEALESTPPHDDAGNPIEP